MPEFRINALNVPVATSLCLGTERFTRIVGFDSTIWLPTWPIRIHPAFSNARTASNPETFPNLPIIKSKPERHYLQLAAAVKKSLFDLQPKARL